MFYSQIILAKRGPLGKIWLAAHWNRKLSKSQIFDTDMEGAVESVLKPTVPLSLRVSGHLLLGIVRIYSRKVKYLYTDCSEALVKIKMAFRPGVVDLPAGQSEAAPATINMNMANFGDFDLDSMPTNFDLLPETDEWVPVTLNISRPQDITMDGAFDSLLSTSGRGGERGGSPTSASRLSISMGAMLGENDDDGLTGLGDRGTDWVEFQPTSDGGAAGTAEAAGRISNTPSDLEAARGSLGGDGPRQSILSARSGRLSVGTPVGGGGGDVEDAAGLLTLGGDDDPLRQLSRLSGGLDGLDGMEEEQDFGGQDFQPDEDDAAFGAGGLGDLGRVSLGAGPDLRLSEAGDDLRLGTPDGAADAAAAAAAAADPEGKGESEAVAGSEQEGEAESKAAAEGEEEDGAGEDPVPPTPSTPTAVFASATAAEEEEAGAASTGRRRKRRRRMVVADSSTTLSSSEVRGAIQDCSDLVTTRTGLPPMPGAATPIRDTSRRRARDPAAATALTLAAPPTKRARDNSDIRSLFTQPSIPGLAPALLALFASRATTRPLPRAPAAADAAAAAQADEVAATAAAAAAAEDTTRSADVEEEEAEAAAASQPATPARPAPAVEGVAAEGEVLTPAQLGSLTPAQRSAYEEARTPAEADGAAAAATTPGGPGTPGWMEEEDRFGGAGLDMEEQEQGAAPLPPLTPASSVGGQREGEAVTPGAATTAAVPEVTAEEEAALEAQLWHPRTVRFLKLLQNGMPTEQQAAATTGEQPQISYHEMSHGRRRKTVAGCFFELLVLKSRDVVEVQQDEPFGDITISKGRHFHRDVPLPEASASAAR